MQSLFNAIFWLAAFTVILILYFIGQNRLRARKISDKQKRQAQQRLRLFKKANARYLSVLVNKMMQGQVLWLEISAKAGPDKLVLIEKSPGKDILRISLKPVRWNDELKSRLLLKGVTKIEDMSDASVLEFQPEADNIFCCVDFIFQNIYGLKNDTRFEYNFSEAK